MNQLEANKQLCRDYFTAFLKGDRDWWQRHIAPDFVRNDPGLPFEVRGPEGVAKLHDVLMPAFPDMQLPLLDFVAEGEKVLVRLRVQGTHTRRLRRPGADRQADRHQRARPVPDPRRRADRALGAARQPRHAQAARRAARLRRVTDPATEPAAHAMKLFLNNTSPYARIARIVLEEKGQTDDRDRGRRPLGRRAATARGQQRRPRADARHRRRPVPDRVAADRAVGRGAAARRHRCSAPTARRAVARAGVAMGVIDAAVHTLIGRKISGAGVRRVTGRPAPAPLDGRRPAPARAGSTERGRGRARHRRDCRGGGARLCAVPVSAGELDARTAAARRADRPARHARRVRAQPTARLRRHGPGSPE